MEMNIVVRNNSESRKKEIILFVRPFWFLPILYSKTVLGVPEVKKIMQALYNAGCIVEGKTNS